MLTQFKNKKLNKSRGMGLVELLVATSIIITATTVVLAIIVSSFRSSNKINSTQVVRQNGNYAINQMTRVIQFADEFQGASLTGSEGSFGSCTAGVSYRSVRLKYQKKDKILFCTADNRLLMNEISYVSSREVVTEVSLIDSTKINVDSGSCSFTCSQDFPQSPPVIGINFKLSLIGPVNSPDKNASGEFSTSVKMRNL